MLLKSLYLQALALNDAFPLDILVSEETVSTLTTYFKMVRLPSVESSTCGWDRYHQDHLDYIDDMVLDWLEQKLGYRIELERGDDGRLQLPAELSQ